jgi:hypothetical protein
MTSIAVVTIEFTDILHESEDPKVITIFIGLGSTREALTTKIGRAASYGTSTVGISGIIVHTQVTKNDRIQQEGEKADVKLRIQYYACAPGRLRTHSVVQGLATESRTRR